MPMRSAPCELGGSTSIAYATALHCQAVRGTALVMLDTSALLLGMGLGLRHATDADHLAVVSTMIQHEKGALRAMRVAALWGLGHTGSFLAVGFFTVLSNVHVPQALQPSCVSDTSHRLCIRHGALASASNPAASAWEPRLLSRPAMRRPNLLPCRLPPKCSRLKSCSAWTRSIRTPRGST